MTQLTQVSGQQQNVNGSSRLQKEPPPPPLYSPMLCHTIPISQKVKERKKEKRDNESSCSSVPQLNTLKVIQYTQLYSEKCNPCGEKIAGLNLLNAKLSLNRYWQGPRSQEVGKEGDYT